MIYDKSTDIESGTVLIYLLRDHINNVNKVNFIFKRTLDFIKTLKKVFNIRFKSINTKTNICC